MGSPFREKIWDSNDPTSSKENEMFNPFALNYHYKMDPTKEVIKLTMTKKSVLKCFAPSLVLGAVLAGLTAYGAFIEKQNNELDPIDLKHPKN